MHFIYTLCLFIYIKYTFVYLQPVRPDEMVPLHLMKDNKYDYKEEMGQYEIESDDSYTD